MTTISTPPGLGEPVPLPGIDLEAINQLGPGQLAYLSTIVDQKFAASLADPATFHDFATYTKGQGGDWSGFNGAAPRKNEKSSGEEPSEPVPGQQADSVDPAAPLPAPPERFYDSIPAIARMLRLKRNTYDATITHFGRHLEAAFSDQSTYLGSPEGLKAFKDGPAYFREVLRYSRQETKKIHDRFPYVTWDPGVDPQLGISAPKLSKVAQAFAAGSIPAENLDRIVNLDQDLDKYVWKVEANPDYKDAILKAFEPTLVEAAEASTPDELSKAKTRWANTIAHHIDADGPPVTDALRKPADNAIRTKNFSDGSGRIWIHADPTLYASFKNFALHQLNKHGTPVRIDPDLLELIAIENPGDDTAEEHESSSTALAKEPDPPQAFDDINDLAIDQDPAEPVAEDDSGNAVSAEYLAELEALSTGQRLAAIVVGMFQTLLTMNPEEVQVKKSHGFSAQLTVIQDIQTAYRTLGLGLLPEEVRRPSGPAGVLPPVIKRPDPGGPNAPLCLDPEHASGFRSPPWTGYLSEILNLGPISPEYTERLACDSKLVGQIWSGHHTVLDQHRAHRTFTPAQRQAILARDRGCQAPGCTLPAIYCQLHHLYPWLLGGQTNIDNAITLCAVHHAAVHNGKWTIKTHHGIHFFQPAPWLDPDQPLLRNLYWAL